MIFMKRSFQRAVPPFSNLRKDNSCPFQLLSVLLIYNILQNDKHCKHDLRLVHIVGCVIIFHKKNFLLTKKYIC